MLTRRRLLYLLPAYATTALAVPIKPPTNPFKKKKPAPPGPIFVYFGTDTSKGVSKGIYQSRFDPKTGQLTPPTLAAATLRPSFMALSTPSATGHRFLYAVNAVADPSATVTTFSLDPHTGALSQIGQVPSGGAGPAYVSLDATGKAAFVANYLGGTLASFHVQPDGALSQPVDTIDFHDTARFGHKGPVPTRQDTPHPHSAVVSPDDRFLLVNDLGNDAISVFIIDPVSGHLTQADTHLFVSDRPGVGPRHLAFHPNGRWVYCINELDSTIDHLLWTTTRSTKVQAFLVNTNTHVKTIDASFPAAKNTAAEIVISPDGNFLYASNRGEDTLVVFSVAQRDGALTLVQRIASGGKTPRHFTLDATGQWLLCGDQDSASITVFRRDPATGKIGGPVQTLSIDSPMFTLFA